MCGADLTYASQAEERECVFCGKKEASHASCKDGHYVCDACHAKKGIEVILEICQKTASRNPIEIAQEIMEDPYIYMHGPEHHVMVGAVLLTAYHNSGGKIQLKEALEEMKERGSQVPGGVCGFWGCCGAGISAGIYMSIVTGATPITGRSWGLSNRTTAKALGEIGRLGGPRCCKRDTYTAIRVAADMTAEELGIKMDCPTEIVCSFSPENQQCLKKACLYHAK